MPRTPLMKNVSLAQPKKKKKRLQNKKTRLTQSMAALTNSAASLGAQVCLLQAVMILSLTASKSKQYPPIPCIAFCHTHAQVAGAAGLISHTL